MAGTGHLRSIQNAVLDNLETGIIVVDELHDVQVCNKNAREMMADAGVLKLHGDRLKCRLASENSLLHESIDQALGIHPDPSESRKIAVRLSGSNFGETLIAVTTPLQIQRLEEKRQNLPVSKAHYTARIPSRKNALITLCDPGKHKNRSIDMLVDLFDLTPAEAALADCLADDRTLEDAAEILGRSIGTTRVQLQSVFGKTDTNRQSSLVRLIMSIP